MHFGREAIVKEVNIEKHEIHVHYVGGSEDEDEWVRCNPDNVQLPPMIEIVWAKVGDSQVISLWGRRVWFLCLLNRWR